MEQVLSILKLVWDNHSQIIEGLVGILSGLVVIAMLIPGDHPDKELQFILDFIKKWSNKK